MKDFQAAREVSRHQKRIGGILKRKFFKIYIFSFTLAFLDHRAIEPDPITLIETQIDSEAQVSSSFMLVADS
jgi:hypothetical protein